MAKKGQTKAESRAIAHERMMRAFELRKHGATYQAIADAVGYRGPSGAYNALKRMLDGQKREAGKELVQLEVERLDMMLVAIAPAVQNGHLGAIDRALRIAKRRAELLGLDAPKEVDVTSGGRPLEFACDPGFGDWVPPAPDADEEAAIKNLENELAGELQDEIE